MVYKEELLKVNGFPWSKDFDSRTLMLDNSFVKDLQLDDYSYCSYTDSLSNVPYLEGENEVERRRREITFLNIQWFMQTLLDRMDRASMYFGLEARVPFADHRIVEYVFNVPWSFKYRNGVEKSLLRDALSDLLSESLITRKKSPYPKTYNPNYEKLLIQKFNDILNDSNSPITPFIDKKKAIAAINAPSDYGKPWFGQLMCFPQLIAYMIQVNYWLDKYKLMV